MNTQNNPKDVNEQWQKSIMSRMISGRILRVPKAGSSLKTTSTSTLSDRGTVENEEITDESRLYSALREAGKYAGGVAAVEVWMMEDLHLVQPDGGWYRNPEFQAADEDALSRIENKNRDDYVSPPPQLPGTGLAGGLWTSDHQEHRTSNNRFSIFPWAHDDFNDHDVLRPDELLDRQDSRRASFGLATLIPRSSRPAKSKIFARFSHRSNLPHSPNPSSSMHKSTIVTKGLSDLNSVQAPATKKTEQEHDEEQPRSNEVSEIPSVSFDLDSNIKSAETKPTSLGNEKQAPANKGAEPSPPKLDGLNDSRSFSSAFREPRPIIGRVSRFFPRRRSSTSIGRRRSLRRSIPFDHDMLWRDIRSLTMDPDQPTFLRLKLLQEAGFDKAAGVRFEFRGQKGIVVYLAKAQVHDEVLNSAENHAYMRSAADLVGAAACVSKTKQALLARKGTPAIHEDAVEKQEMDNDETAVAGALQKYIGKLKGGDLQPPPPMSSRQSILTFFGALITLIVLVLISESIKMGSDGRYLIVLGPFGALMTLQYGLTMAPASQPRNALFGQTISVSIAMATTYIPEDAIPQWLRIPLATATAIAAMTRLGITHPPAGAAALIVSSGRFDWMVLPLILLGNVVALITGTLINNLTDKRQYPTYLHLGISCPFGDTCISRSDDRQEVETIDQKNSTVSAKPTKSVSKSELDDESESSVAINA